MLQVNQKDSTDVVLVSLLLTLNSFTPFSSVSIADFEQIFVGWTATKTACQFG